MLQEKGSVLSRVGIAFGLAAVSGSLGKAILGRLGDGFGVTRCVILSKARRAVAILLVIAHPLAPAFAVLPPLGLMLNGTSSVLYGTMPDLAPHGRVAHAFAAFYTWTLGGSALATPLLYDPPGDAVGPRWAAAAAFAVVPIMLVLSPHLAREPRPLFETPLPQMAAGRFPAARRPRSTKDRTHPSS